MSDTPTQNKVPERGRKIETKTVEIQIRTTGMDFWSVLEYQLLYKKNVKGADKIGKEL